MASEFADGTAPWELAFYEQAAAPRLQEALRRMGSTVVPSPWWRSRGNTACSGVKWQEQQGRSVLSFGGNILLRKGEKRECLSVVWIGELKHEEQSRKGHLRGAPGPGLPAVLQGRRH